MPNTQALSAFGNRLIFFVVGAFAALALLVPAAASAAGTPNISLEKKAPKQALIGTQQKVTLVAKNPAGEIRGYNLTFRDVLPKGVEYVAGSSSVAPRVLEDEPAEGETTLLFENVADLSANSEYALTYEVKPSTTFFSISEHKVDYTNEAEDFVSQKPRKKPTANEKGEIVSGFKGNSAATATTELTAVEIEKSEPSPEGEILRGVHEHQTVYTLTIRNNKVGPTSELEVEDWLPAGLEFLGCGTVDNTTNTKTNPGSREEYAGSGLIDPGNAPEAAECAKHLPYFVATEEHQFEGEAEPGVFTHVKWKGLGELAPGAELKLQYIAAVPILRNSMNWLGTAPSAESLGQVANLNNNQGPETYDEEPLVNHAEVKGEYEETEVSDEDELTRTAEDLAIQKSVTPGEIEQGEESIWTFNVESSEYRYVNGVEINDTLPNGLCPLGAENYEGPSGAVTEELEECDPSPGAEPTYEIVGSGKGPQPAEYTKVEEQENGTFKIHWDESSVPGALEQMTPSEHLVLKFPTRTRTHYQENFKSTTPVLTGDSWTNHVETQGDDFAICAPGDPLCEGVGQKIFTEEPEGTPDFDVSEASQQAGGVTIDKTVRENDGNLVPEDCKGPQSEYVQGLVSSSEPKLPLYAPGDEICWTLRVDFAAKLYAGHPVVTDFVPSDEEYVPGSAVKMEGSEFPEGQNTIPAEFTEEFEGEKESLQWELGESVKAGHQVFEWRFRTKVKKEPNLSPEEITGNLMKFVYSDTEGQTFPLRDRAEVERQEPVIELAKGITAVEGTPTPGGFSTTATAHGGEVVTYALKLSNGGNMDAEGAEVWDFLPKGIECSDVVAESLEESGGTCAEGKIVWTGLAVAEAGTTTVTYQVKLPVDFGSAHAFTNEAGVTRYGSATNTGGEFEYVPSENIDPEAPPANTEPIPRAKATVTTALAELKKRATTETTQSGNSASQATIGEIVDYEVEATTPEGSILYGSPTVTDSLPTNLEFLGVTSAKIDGEEFSAIAGMELEETANGFVVHFPAEYVNPAGSGTDVVLVKFKARVLNVPGNARGTTAINGAVFEFADKEGASPTELPARAETPIVEPHLGLAKKSTPTTKVKPGEVVKYEVTVNNLEEGAFINVSTANNVVVKDTIPAGMKVTNPGTGTVEGSEIHWTIAEVKPGAANAVVLKYEAEVETPAKVASVFKNVVTATTQSLPNEVGGTPPPETRTSGSGYAAEASKTVSLLGATASKTVNPTEGTIGKELTYTLHLNMPANINYFNTTLVDTLPPGVAYDETVSAKCTTGCPPGTEGEAFASTKASTTTPGATYAGWYFGDFAASGEERVLTVVFKGHVKEEKTAGVKVEAKQSLQNSVVGLYNAATGTAKPTEVPTPGANGFTEQTAPATATTKVIEPKVTLAKSVAGTPPLAGGTTAEPNTLLTYTLTVNDTDNVKNEGLSPAYDVEVEDTNPTANLRDITPVEGAQYVVSGAGEPLRWLLPEVAVGSPITLTYTARLLESEELEADEEIKNAATVPLYFGLPEPERGEAPEFREYEGPTAEKNVEVALPKIAVTKTTGVAGFPDSATTEVGAEFPWRVVVKNESAVAGAKAVSVTDTLPAGWEYVPGSTEFKAVGAAVIAAAGNPEEPSGEPGTLIWKEVASSLPPTASVEVFFKAKPTTAATPGANVNSATGAFEDLTGSPGGEGTPYEATDTAEAELIAPELAIEKTPDGGETVAGSADHYEIKVSNNGTGPANAVQVKDVLRPGQEFVGPATASPATGFEEKTVEEDEPAPGETTIYWTVAQIPAGSSVTIRVPIVTPASLAEGTEITDIATASSPQQAEEPSDEGSFIVHREADLKIEKEADRPNINGGEKINYKLTAKNLGPSDASSVVVTDKLPEDTAFVKAEPSASCSFDAATEVITCNVGELAVGAKAEFHVEVEVISAQLEPIFNTAEVSGKEKDPELGNNTKTVETPIGGSADLSIVKTGPSTPVLLGNEFTYMLEVKNEGPSDAAAVKVIDELPAEVEFVEATAPLGTTCVEAGGVLTCELGTFVRNATPVVIEVTVKAVALSPVGKETENTAEVESPTTDPNEANNEDTAKTEIVPAADLALTKTAPAKVEPNGELTYNLKVENLGPSDAHGVTVTDPLPTGVEFLSASEGCAMAANVVTCEVQPAGGFLEVGETAEFQVTVHVPFALGGKTLSNTASVEAEEGDPNPENNTDTATTTVGPAADLSITKTMGAAQAGKPLTYTLAITNHGPSTSSAVTVKDTLPAGTTFQSAAPSQGTCAANGQAVTCQLGPLASGASAQVSITVEVSASASGTLRNAATVEGPEPDPDKSNNESSVEGPITPAPPSAPNLKVVKTASTSTPEVGVPFTYDVAVTNVSGATAKNVKVVDTLNGPVVVGTVKPESGSCHVKGSKIECQIPRIPVGKTVHIRYTVTATTPGKLSNTASAEAANGETAPANNHAVKGVTAKAPTGSFKLTKTASRPVVPGGGKVGFTITLRNGGKALSEATICDRLPAALVFVKAAGAKFVNGEACWTKAYVAPHKTLTLHLVARAVNGYKAVRARNVATAVAANAKKRSASATVRIEPSFAGAPGGVTG
jgi:large repetitive protein